MNPFTHSPCAVRRIQHRERMPYTSMMDGTYQPLIALAQVVMIDVALAGDNAIVVGLAASRVAPGMRRNVIFWGIAAAVVLRVLFAVIATRLFAIIGLTLAGGILLLWVSWKMYRELRRSHDNETDVAGGGNANEPQMSMSFRAAVVQIIVADLSMSLDNVLAVAGAAKDHLAVLVIGLGLSILLMAVAANFIAKLLVRHAWISWLGLAIVLYVALEMIWRGFFEVAAHA
jgi:YjbE family integral membrane protein